MVDPIQRESTYKDYLADLLISNGIDINGGYVYKTLVNGDYTDDIDINTNLNGQARKIVNFLNRTQQCRIVRTWPSYGQFKMLCEKDGDCCYVDIVDPKSQPKFNSEIFDLRYTEIKGKKLIVLKNGDVERTKELVQELRQRQYKSWENMREKDIHYFSRWNILN